MHALSPSTDLLSVRVVDRRSTEYTVRLPYGSQRITSTETEKVLTSSAVEVRYTMHTESPTGGGSGPHIQDVRLLPYVPEEGAEPEDTPGEVRFLRDMEESGFVNPTPWEGLSSLESVTRFPMFRRYGEYLAGLWEERHPD